MLHNIWRASHLSEHGVHVGCSAAFSSVASLKCPALTLTDVQHSKKDNNKDFLAAASSLKYGMWCV